MDPKSWEQVCQYFDRCAELSDEECESLLESEPSVEIREAFWRLRSLHHQNQGDGFLDRPPGLPADLSEIAERQNRFSAGDKLANRFEIIRLIGYGGMGEVYEATDLELQEPVAIKVLTGAASLQGNAIIRFRREVQLARRITHPNVCRLFDLGRHTSPAGDVVFLTMELLEGDTLSQRLKKQKLLTAAEARPIVEQIAAGLAAAHRSGIVHRDLKPSNIMLCADRAVIMDFGLARHDQSGGDPSLTSTGKVIGTLTYIAPEQLTGAAITAKTDIYTFGLVMYEMVTGRRPFESESSLAAANRRLTESAPSPRSVVPNLDARWQNAILSCLERDSAMRPESAEAVVGLLDSAPKFRLHPVTRRRILQSVGGLAAAGTLVSLREPISRYLNRRLVSAPGAKILVTEIENKAGDPKLAGITELFRLQLGQSPEFNVVDEASLKPVYAQMVLKPDAPLTPEVKREASWRAEIPLAVFASLNSLGGNYTLDVQLENRGSSPENPARREVKTFEARGRNDVMEAVSAGAKWVRTVAGESQDSIAKTDRLPEDVTTPSWEAFSFFAQAEKYGTTNRLTEAITMLDAALDKDPEFTLASMRRADLLMALSRREEGLLEWQRANRLLEKRRVTRREELRIRGMYLADGGDWQGSDRYFAQWSLEFPNDWRGLFYRSTPLLLAGKAFDLIRLLKRVNEIRPDYAGAYEQLSICYIALGQWENAQAAIGELRGLGEVERPLQQEGILAFSRGQFSAANHRFEKLQKSSSAVWSSKGYLFGVLSRLELKQYHLAELLVTEALAQTPSGDSAVHRAGLFFASAWTALFLGQAGRIQKAVEDALRLDRGVFSVRQAAELYMRTAEREKALKLVKSTPALASVHDYRLVRRQMEAEVLLARKDFEGATAAFEEAADLLSPLQYRPFLGKAYKAVGLPERAKAIWRDIALRPWVMWYRPLEENPGVWREALERSVGESDPYLQMMRSATVSE